MNLSAVDYTSVVLASVQAGIAAALGAQVAGFALPPAIVFALVVAGAMIAVVTANLPAVGRKSAA